ncbi:hypothetical protein BGX33_007254 [Mortierella sp. NVP41]|nr:hypothetical protein BGX33_007254 [Mortierella sp. NVP41]
MDNILDSDDPMVALMARAIGQNPNNSTTQHSAIPSAAAQVSSLNDINPTTSSASVTPHLGVPGVPGLGSTAAVEFLDAEADTADFLDSMIPSALSSTISMSSPLPLPLPWSPSHDMIWTEDEPLAISANSSLEVDGEGGMGMSLPPVVATTAQAQEMTRGGMAGEMMMEVPAVVVAEPAVVPVAVTPTPMPRPPVMGRDYRSYLNSTKPRNEDVNYTPNVVAVMPAAATLLEQQRNGTEETRVPLTVHGGAGVGGVDHGAAVAASTTAAAEIRTASDMEIDAPEVLAMAHPGTTATLVQDVQSTSLTEPQQMAHSLSTLSSSQAPTLSVSAPALVPASVSASAAPTVLLGTGSAAIDSGSEPQALAVAESEVEPVAVESATTKPASTESAAAAAESGVTGALTTTEPAATDSVRTESETEPETTADQPSTATATSQLTTIAPSTVPTKPTKPQKVRRSMPVHHHASWHFVPGSDLAFLSEMKASDADLKRFRREHDWLEERVRRPKRDHESDQLLDKALGLTRMVVVPSPPSMHKEYYQHQQQYRQYPGYHNRPSDSPRHSSPTRQGRHSSPTRQGRHSSPTRQGRHSSPTRQGKVKEGEEGEQRAKRRAGEVQDDDREGRSKDTATTSTKQPRHQYTKHPSTAAVRLSTDSRLAFSILKTNLSSELEEQTRLETDQRILERIVERTSAQLTTTTELQERAEARLRELQERQPGQEQELQKLERLERACLELRDRQRQQAEEEIRQLEETLRLLTSQREQKLVAQGQMLERQQVEMEHAAVAVQSV